MRSFLTSLIATLAFAADWNYNQLGEDWGSIKSEYSACKNGKA